MHLFVHAHPDDETLATGAAILALTRAGQPCAVLTATRGEQGEIVPGVVPDGVALQDWRLQERRTALSILGVRESGLLGAPPARAAGLPDRSYADSGMRWETPTVAGPVPDAPANALSSADLDEVVADLTAYATAIGAHVLVSYDAAGGYGHPDHVRLHRATSLAAAALGRPFLEIVETDGTGDIAWYEVDPADPDLIGAHRAYASQFTVHGTRIVHVGGQEQDLVSRVGLRRHS